MKKAHPMEERYRQQSRNRVEGWVNESRACQTITFEQAVLFIKHSVQVDWGGRVFDRKFCDETYKDGAKIFDKASAYLNSPLMKALE